MFQIHKVERPIRKVMLLMDNKLVSTFIETRKIQCYCLCIRLVITFQLKNRD